MHYVPDGLLPDSLVDTGESLFEGGQRMVSGLQRHLHHGTMGRFLGGGDDNEDGDGASRGRHGGSGRDQGLHIQLTRSCTAWSAGHKTEHSIANAYIAAILGAEHFVYIENQFFITATSDEQHPVGNKIGRAIVQRIQRAHEQDEDFGMVVCIPAVPGFAGDLKSDGALGTRAIMEYQYGSISRGKNSIYGALEAAGVTDPKKYLRFYNLRNYDRINTAPVMDKAEKASGVPYESARREFADNVQSGYDGDGNDTQGAFGDKYQRYQEAAADAVRKQPSLSKTADSVAACYMNAGPDLTTQPWAGSLDTGPGGPGGPGPYAATYQESGGESGGPPGPPPGPPGPGGEIAAFVSEQLYIHSKVLIADDRLVICGSANLNDRSQLGTHDSEIAVVIEDPDHPVQTTMAGKPYVVSEFAASLRRQLFRKHIGLLPDQRCDQPTQNVSLFIVFFPLLLFSLLSTLYSLLSSLSVHFTNYQFSPINAAPNAYDWDSPADHLVADPLSSNFTRLWQGTAATNTAVFDDVFHCVPSDRVRNWDQYESFYAKYFTTPGEKESEKDKKEREKMLEKIKQMEKDHGEGDFFFPPPGPPPDGPPPAGFDGSVPPPPPPGHEGGPPGPPLDGKVLVKVEYGHVVPGFPGGPAAVKSRLAEVRGNLVEMPLDFLVEVKDLAKAGLTLNSLTDELYT